ncbi:MAG: AmmeMemoRadiSam system protein B [bacterium]
MDSHVEFEGAIPPDAIRNPTVAGRFYPADPRMLRQEIEKLLHRAQPEIRSARLTALVAPHAGYSYSGSVAAHAYKLLLQAKAQTIIVIAPSHFERFPFISVFNGKSYRTPLGELPVDHALAARLLACDTQFAAAWNGHRDHGGRTEHALEIQLPFLQMTRPECAIVPVVMGHQRWELCETLGHHLAKVAEEAPFVILASSDLSHYHNQEEALQLDQRFMQLLTAQNPRALYDAVAQHECEACGAGPVIATMIAAQQLHADQVDLLCYNTSGEASDDFSRVVGYLAASFSRAVT